MSKVSALSGKTWEEPRERPTSGGVKAGGMARILVVDDEPIIAMTVADWLDDLGHTVLGPVGDLKSALALAQGAIDAVILDVTLGVQTTAALAEQLAARGVPFAVATGHDGTSVGAAYARGVMLPKPFLFETFRQTVGRLLTAGASTPLRD